MFFNLIFFLTYGTERKLNQSVKVKIDFHNEIFKKNIIIITFRFFV